jgi:hypothetical protein
VFPSATVLKSTVSQPVLPPQGFLRGKIEGFSAEAARNLREFCVTQYVPDCETLAGTFTIRRAVDPAEWRRIMKVWRTAVVRRGWAGVWRVELQKRGVPHVHASLWLPPGVRFAEVRDLWLRCTGEENDRAARKYAVMGKWLRSAGWTVYLALHDGKHKGEQLGWLGKQWGVWNRERFVAIQELPCSRELTPREETHVRRFLRRLMRAKGSKAKLGRSGFMRCMDAAPVVRFLRALDSGMVGEAVAPDVRACGPLRLMAAGVVRVGGSVVAEYPERVVSLLV